MRFMFFIGSHQHYLQLLVKRNKDKTTHAQWMQSIVDDGYWACHLLAPALKRMGHEVFLCSPEEMHSQALWCKENNISLHLLEENYVQVCAEQVARFKPDVLYMDSVITRHDAFVSRFTFRPRVVAGWHATHTLPHMHFTCFDLILSSHAECLELSTQMGARHVAFAYPGFPVELRDVFPRHKRSDLCFSGNWAISHPRRNQLLGELARRLPEQGAVNCAFHIALYPDSPPCPDEVLALNQGEVWGRSMLRAFAGARIVLNAYCSVNNGPQNLSPNMRQLESMGVGSFLLTEQSPNMEAFFKPGRDLETFADLDELLDKARYYLAHPEEREAVAARGQATCLHNFNMDIRARAFLDKLRRAMEARPYSLAELFREVRAVVEAAAHKNDVLGEEKAAHVVRAALEDIPELMDRGEGSMANTLLTELERLPLGTQRNLRFCQALRCLALKDVPEARRLLEAELQDHPGNDEARRTLSDILLWQAAPTAA